MKGVADPKSGWSRYNRNTIINMVDQLQYHTYWCIFPVSVQQFVYNVAIFTLNPVRSLPCCKKLSPYQAPSLITVAPYVITQGAKDKDKDIL